MRRIAAAAFLALCVPALSAAQTTAPAPNGEEVYRQHCASCHNGTLLAFSVDGE